MRFPRKDSRCWVEGQTNFRPNIPLWGPPSLHKEETPEGLLICFASCPFALPMDLLGTHPPDTSISNPHLRESWWLRW